MPCRRTPLFATVRACDQRFPRLPDASEGSIPATLALRLVHVDDSPKPALLVPTELSIGTFADHSRLTPVPGPCAGRLGEKCTVIPGYTGYMKTAISIPDETFAKASRRAHDLGMSRSEFFTRAAARYLDELDAESVTHQIDLAVDALGSGDDSAMNAVATGHRVLDAESGKW